MIDAKRLSEVIDHVLTQRSESYELNLKCQGAIEILEALRAEITSGQRTTLPAPEAVDPSPPAAAEETDLPAQLTLAAERLRAAKNAGRGHRGKARSTRKGND